VVDAGIRDGDHVVVRSQDDADPGSVVAARVLGEAPDAVELTLKRLPCGTAAGCCCRPNPAYQPIMLHDGDRIVGAVVTVLRDLHGDAARVALQELQEMSGSLP
jgi:SOS-response transcriptional repressor LexA